MATRTPSRTKPSARRLLVEAEGTPFAPSPAVHAVVEVMDGRARNDEIDPEAWLRALRASDGDVAVYLELSGDHEWWLAYDPADASPWDGDGPIESGENAEAGRLFEGFGRLSGPWHLWTTYPSGPWDHDALPRGIVADRLAGLYREHVPEDRCDIRRSKVVPLGDAPEFVRERIDGEGPNSG